MWGGGVLHVWMYTRACCLLSHDCPGLPCHSWKQHGDRIVDDIGTVRARVWRAALRAASAEVGDRRIAREAADRTADRFIDRLARDSEPRRPEAWASTVGRHEARHLVRMQRQTTTGLPADGDEDGKWPERSDSDKEPIPRGSLGRILATRGRLLTRKQREVVWWVSRGASLHQIARSLRRDRSALRRLLDRALVRLRGGRRRKG